MSCLGKSDDEWAHSQSQPGPAVYGSPLGPGSLSPMGPVCRHGCAIASSTGDRARYVGLVEGAPVNLGEHLLFRVSGTVERLGDDLITMRSPDYDEPIVFSAEDVTPEELPLVVPGARVEITEGYLDEPGRRSRFWRVKVLRRGPHPD